MRGLTAEKARERKASGLCPRHDVPAQPGRVLCARCNGKVSMAQRYRIPQVTLDAMRAALGGIALPLLVVLASCAGAR